MRLQTIHRSLSKASRSLTPIALLASPRYLPHRTLSTTQLRPANPQPQDPSSLLSKPLPMADPQPSPQITESTLTSALQAKMNTTHIQIADISGGCGQSFTALIVSPDFQGKSALQRHRLVNAALREEIKEIHAWTPRCLTVEQWEKEKGGSGS